MTLADLIELLHQLPAELHELPVVFDPSSSREDVTYVMAYPQGMPPGRRAGVYLFTGLNPYTGQLGIVYPPRMLVRNPEQETCPRCRGSKEVTGVPGRHPDQCYVCPECNGEGKVWAGPSTPVVGDPEDTP